MQTASQVTVSGSLKVMVLLNSSQASASLLNSTANLAESKRSQHCHLHHDHRTRMCKHHYPKLSTLVHISVALIIAPCTCGSCKQNMWDLNSIFGTPADLGALTKAMHNKGE